MHWLRAVTIVALLAVAVVAGGAAIRLAVLLGELQTAAVVGLLALLLVVAVARGAHGRPWRSNPYW